ncbi:MAG: cupin domain-containing protein [Sphaerochaetaceae bacterium]|nr:cupin domain-containing protein [Sphaerochaetaceae bacterium]MDD3859929.1 cupin domain-containing protein [Bacteroidales bacterium]MDD4842123.1 cupin domain-containing protein [Sphaerochaetaceae bacterium]
MSVVKYQKKVDLSGIKKDGFAKTIRLDGAFPRINLYQCELDKGHYVTPETFKEGEKSQIFFFTKGKGYVATETTTHNITENAIFIPLYDTEKFAFYSTEGLEWLEITIDLVEEEIAKMDFARMTLPYFCPLSKCLRYEEKFKGNGVLSYSVIQHDEICGLGMASMGVTVGKGPNYVGDHSHVDLAQWYYGLEGNSIRYTADNTTVELKQGDMTYTPKGYVHASEAKEGEIINYVWFEYIC